MADFKSAEENREKLLYCQKITDEIQSESKKPVCHLSFSHKAFSITDSHLGGIPYLPYNQKYPFGKDGQRLWLCAQINFAQMPVMEGFPHEGILQFFLSDWHYDAGFGLYSEYPFAIDQSQWRVIYYPSVDLSITEEYCKNKMPEFQEGDEDLWRTPKVPMKMSFSAVSEEGVGDTDYRFKKLFAQRLAAYVPDGDLEDYMPYVLHSNDPEDSNILRSIEKQIDIGGCKIGGYPRYEQDDPRVYTEDCNEPLEEWDTLLFQLDDNTFTFPAGDIGEMDFDLNGGTLNFLIRSEDLKKRDFSKVLAQWSCS